MEDHRKFINDSGGLFDCHPILCVDSVPRSIDFYMNLLGFRLGWSWSGKEQKFLEPGDLAEPDFALVQRGHVQPIIRPWGMYELRLRDPVGHTLRVAAPPACAPVDVN